MRNPSDTTQLLIAARDGSEEARDELFELLYDELRLAAHRQLRRHAGRPLDTTELVHEAFLKLCASDRLSARDRSHFMALSARAMRQILVDHFRAQAAAKRGGLARPLTLEEEGVPVADRGAVVLAIDEALNELANLSQRTARVVELRFFGGMTEAEVADVLEVSVRTVSGEWRKARAWLTKELGFS